VLANSHQLQANIPSIGAK